MNNILQERDDLIYHLREKIKELEGELQRARSSEIAWLKLYQDKVRDMEELLLLYKKEEPCEKI